MKANKIVQKPWGKEIWMELNEFYCFKQLHVKKDHQLSLQYHNIKTETMCVAWGRAEITIGDSIMELTLGDFIHIPPGTTHRVKAISDLMIVETSTPEVDDIIRVKDDYKRIEENES